MNLRTLAARMGRQTFGMVLVLFCILCPLAGCHHELPPASAPQAARDLSVAVVGDEPGSDGLAVRGLEQQLSLARYRVLGGASPDTPADLTLRVRVSEGEAVYAGGFLKIRNWTRYDVVVDVVDAEGEVVDVLAVDVTGQGLTQEDLEPLASALSRSHALGHAYRLRQRKAAAAAQAVRQAEAEARELQMELERAAAEARERREREVRSAWELTDVDACRSPATETACDSVSDFVQRFPDEERAAEARVLIEAAAPRLAELREESAWAKVDVASCKNPRSTDSCDSVDLYLGEFSEGKHVEQARQLRARSEKRIAALVAARERAEAAQASARTESSWYSSGQSHAGGNVHVSGYYRKNGTYVRPHTRRSKRR
ncbi:hypothetical protein [Sorangium sp. So ce861]|uniref:hypothetical protein n=1 Tax=Sorangium sp. So ce861 TaxID=3133323 RepID=UPI003F641F71